MTQNITFLGASYSNVPAVELPKTGGGTASFTDVSDTTAVAAQVAEGAYFYTAAGVKTEGTATGGSMVIRDEADSHGGTIRHITAGDVVTGTIQITSNGTVDVAAYADAEVSVTPAAGTEGTPTATKGTVSNHQVSITPSVTNTAGYIPGGTKTGTAVTVTASELASGNKEITSNGTGIDVVGYSTVSVDVASSNVYTAKLAGDGNENTCYIQLNHAGTKYYRKYLTPSFTFEDGDELYIYAQASNPSQAHIFIDDIEVATSPAVANGSIDYTYSLPGQTITVTFMNFNTSCYVRIYTRQNTVTISGQGDSSNCYMRYGSNSTAYYQDGTVLDLSDFNVRHLHFYAKDPSGIATISVNGITVKTASSSGGLASFDADFPTSDLVVEMTYGATVNINIVATSTTTTLNGMVPVDGYAFVNVKGWSEAQAEGFIYRNMSGVEWPDGVTYIGSYAFASCSNLNMPSLPSTVTTIQTYAFYQCRNLTLASLPSGLRTISQYAFYYCSSLTIASLPSTVTSIGDYAFSGCSSITVSSLPSGLTTLGTYAFSSCAGITVSTVPSGITKINDAVFSACTSITSFTVPSGVTSIGTNAFQSCTSLATLTLPSTITVINSYAFRLCSSLTTVSCDGTITTLGSSAFGGDSTHTMTLTSASFPNLALTSNLGAVFGSSTATGACQSLAFCDIGNATGIASGAFQNCYALTKLVIRKTSVCTLANTSAFTNTPMSGYNNLTGTVYVPNSLISSYQTATNWKTLYNNGTVTFTAIEGSLYEL